MQRITGLQPVVGKNPKILFLGSMPSQTSLDTGRYYGHPRNHFWPILGDLYGFDPALDYAQRLQALRLRGVALWDVLSSCLRQGSLDHTIREARLNDIPGFLRRYPTISTIALNGGTAAKTYRRHFAQTDGRRVVALPSSSPIPTRACPDLAAKLAVWRERLFE